jgi:hypothetical protein
MSDICKCGRLDLGQSFGFGSTDPKAKTRGSHTRDQCYDILNRRLNRKKKTKIE